MSGDTSKIGGMINEMAMEVRSLLKQAFEIAWYSRGSIQYHSALLLSPLERDVAVEYYSKRLEDQKKSMNPVY